MNKSDYLKTCILAAVVLCLFLPKSFGSGLVLLVLWFVVWLLYNAVRLLLKPAERKRRSTRIAIWFATLVVIGMVQVHWEATGLRNADQAARAVLAHKARTGAYPTALGEVGMDAAAMQQEWQLTYQLRDGKPALYYPAILMPLSTYGFDFEQQRWQLDAY